MIETTPDSATARPKAGLIAWAGWTSILAVMYVAAGYLGQLLALQPASTTFVWPSSGIALAAVLVMGKRALTGIFIGAAAVYGQIYYDGASIGGALATIGAAVAIGVGAALQPMAAVALLRRFDLIRNPFASAAAIGRSLTLLGIACGISASVGVAALTALGLIPGEESMRLWGTWWLGDLMGILLFAPLTTAFVRKASVTIALLVVVLAVGIGGTYVASTGIRGDAAVAWDNNADTETARLTTTLQQWIETSLTPVHAMATLFQGSAQVSDNEFWEAVNLLEDNHQDFFPSTLVVALPVDFDDGENWEIAHSIEDQGRLALGNDLTEESALEQAVKVALERPGQTVIGSVYRDATGTAWLVPAIDVEANGARHVILGLIDLTQMVDGLFKTQAPEGIEMRLFGRTPGQQLEEAILLHDHDKIADDTVVTKTIRGVAGSAKFTFLWDVTAGFQGGTKSNLANIVLVGGLFATALLSLFVNFLLRQNEQTRLLVKERTAELADREAELRLALDNMPGAMILTGKDLNIRLLNTEISSFLGVPSDLLKPGASHEELIHYMVGQGFHGEGIDAEAALQEHLRRPTDRPSNAYTRDGRTLEFRRRRTAEGDLITIVTDVTERIKSEETTQTLREAIEGFSDSIILYDKEERVVFTNDRYHELYPNSPPKDEITGYTQEQLLRRSLEAGLIGDSLARSDPENWLAGRLEERRTNRFLIAETVHSTGRTLLIRHRPTTDGGLIVAHTDITERKTAEEEVAQKEALLRIAMDNMPGGMFMMDEELNFLVFNERFSKIYELPQGAIRQGGSIRDPVRFRAERGDYGPGDVDELVEQRIEKYSSKETERLEERLPNGRVVEFLRQPADGGGTVGVVTDITERKASEVQLQRIKERLDLALEGSGAGLWDWNIKTGDQFMDDRWARMLGYELDELEQNFSVFERLLHPEDAPAVMASIERALQSDASSFDQEFRLRSKTGEWVWILSRGKVSERDKNGDPMRLIGTHTNITERKRAEATLRESEERVRTLVENMRGIVYRCLLDDAWTMTYIGGAVEEITGYPRSDFEDNAVRTFGDSIHPEDADAVTREVEEAVAAHRDFTLEYRIRHRDGSYRWVLSVGKPILESDGELKWLDGTLFDITERKQAEDRFRALLESAPDATVIVDNEGTIIQSNQQAETLFGYTTDELLGQKVEIILPDRFRERHPVHRDNYFAQPGVRPMGVGLELFGHAKDGREFPIEISLGPIETEQGTLVSAAVRDITERKKAEKELSQAHSLITESLRYASRIQRALLPAQAVLDDVFKDHAIIWEPKDMVGGDMVWLRQAHGGTYLVVADCTGHGPPGAFMTMICTGALDQALAEMKVPDPAEVLQRMNVRIKSALGQDGGQGESDDGVELGVCHVDASQRQVTFAGARFSISMVQGETLEEVKGDRYAIGYRYVSRDALFTNHRRPIENGMQFYLWTDGIIDQVGGPKRRGFGKRRLKRIILNYGDMGMARQKTEILREFVEYQNAEVRRDDITFIGFVPRYR